MHAAVLRAVRTKAQGDGVTLEWEQIVQFPFNAYVLRAACGYSRRDVRLTGNEGVGVQGRAVLSDGRHIGDWHVFLFQLFFFDI